MSRGRTLLALAALALCTQAPLASAREEPLWEAGAGLTLLDFPDYRGSSQSRGYVLPIPYLI